MRISARESSKEAARQLHPEIENKNQQQMLAYRELPEEVLFAEQWVRVTLDQKELPGYKGDRTVCSICGEGINYERYTIRDGQKLCQGCASPEARYYQPLANEPGKAG